MTLNKSWLRLFFHFWFTITSAVIFFSCQKDQKTSNGKLRIVTTTGILGDAVENITGGNAEIISLMGPGVDPHLYKASYQDLEAMANADIIVYNGLHLEGKMIEVIKRLSRQKKIIAAADGLNQNDLLKNSEYENADPHIWFDVSIWRKAVDFIGTQIISRDSIHGDKYLKNLQQYNHTLDSLDNWVKKEIFSIPRQNRVLITAHDAFGYFGKAYDIEVKGLQGISTLSDFGLNDISSLVNDITERKIKAVFVESSISEKSINAVIEGCKSRGHNVALGGTLYSDALGEKGTTTGSYTGIVKHNIKTIVKALK